MDAVDHGPDGALRQRGQHVVAERANGGDPLLHRARAERDADHVDALARELVEIHGRIETGDAPDAYDAAADGGRVDIALLRMAPDEIDHDVGTARLRPLANDGDEILAGGIDRNGNSERA